MAKGADLSEGSSGDNISHFAAIRVRSSGRGNLQIKISSLDMIKEKTLVPFAMQALGRTIPTRLVNFTEQRAAFTIQTTGSDEYMRVDRITVFIKEVFTS